MTDPKLLAPPTDVLRGAPDKTGTTGAMPREGWRRKNGGMPAAPALWTTRRVMDFTDDPEPCWGSYPKGFVAWACRLLDVDPREVLHLCSGQLRRGQGLRVDLRTSQRPDVVADARRLPFADDSFRAVMIDPPYQVEYARDLYGEGMPAWMKRNDLYPRPAHLLAEAARVVAPCGAVTMLHFLVPMAKAPLRLQAVHGITTGAGYRIRAFSVYRKEQDALFPTEAP